VTTLDSIVLPLSDSRALVEHGIVLDTALVWWKQVGKDDRPTVHARQGSFLSFIDCPAPVLSELLGAIRVKADAMEVKADRRMEVVRHEQGLIVWEIIGHGRGTCEDDWQAAVGMGDTDFLAAIALLMEV